MIRGIVTIAPFVSVIFFPWPLTILLAGAAAFFEPLAPLAVGLFADALYFVPSAGLPLFTVYGAVATAAALIVRARLRPGSME